MAKQSAAKKVEAKSADKKKQAEWLAPYHWKPGQSGNPTGRALKKPITDRYKEAIETELPDEVRIKLGLKPGSTMGDAIARRMSIRAIDGRDAVNAAKEVREAIEGRAPQALDLKHSGKIQIDVVYQDERKKED